jgi:hypothetical protein
MEKLKKNLAVLWTRYHRKRRSHLLVELRRWLDCFFFLLSFDTSHTCSQKFI